MRGKRSKLILKLSAVLLLVLLLAGIRAIEQQLFYDPFLPFFKGEFTGQPLPAYDPYKLISALTARYFLNAIVSLAILYVLFRDRDILRFSVLLYLLFFALLLVAFFVIIDVSANENRLALFYVRRFLIQPLFVILFIPAFYYQRQIAKK